MRILRAVNQVVTSHLWVPILLSFCKMGSLSIVNVSSGQWSRIAHLREQEPGRRR